MIYFNSDYCEGAHPKILEALNKTNFEQTEGYGTDQYCLQAAQLIKNNCNRQDVDVHFLVGGTQTNLTVISAALRPHQGVIAAESGHVNVHESGAIEATGHKVIILPSADGKLTANQVKEAYDNHFNDDNHEHMVQPKLVYISNPTEIGTIYNKTELTELYRICKENDLILYIDGARLGFALCALNNDLDLPTIARLCDVFYIGGTKVGALLGEALVICKESLKPDFRYIIKQKGGMLAKGRILGIQFLTLFTDNLYLEISQHGNMLAQLIKDACIRKGYPFLIDSSTNQQFPIMPKEVLEKLGKNYGYSFWQKIDDLHSAVRFCTSWATREEDILKLVEDILKA